MRTAKRQRGALTPVNLQECYVHPGEYSAKMLIDPAVSTDTESVEVRIRNADGSDLQSTSRRWGTKLTFSFLIDESTPDGVVMIDVTLRDRGGRARAERFRVWIVK